MHRRDLLKGAALATLGSGLVKVAPVAAQAWAPRPLSLWYREPADEWVQALPVGNGRIGAMVHGGVATERLQLNEDTFFAGGPYDPTSPDALAGLPEVRRLIWEGKYRDAEKVANETMLGRPKTQMSYQPIGDLLITTSGLENGRNYVRELDLETGIASTRWDHGSLKIRREVFASPVDQLIVVRLLSERPGRMAVTLILASPQSATASIEGGDTLILAGTSPSENGVEGRLKFEARAKVIASGGTMRPAGGAIHVAAPDEIIVLIAIATSYRRFDDVSGNPEAANRSRIAAVAGHSYQDIRGRHIAEHRRLFGRVTIDLGPTPAMPTDERIRAFATGNDPALAALYYQYGRYLTLASSRPGTQPSNLQGIWNERTNPSWQSKWTININTEMNYWLPDQANLGECVEPLLRMVKELSITGAKVARNMYGARGWVVHNNTDLWRAAAPVDGAVWSLWPMGGAWLLQNLWDHWDYSRDRDFLAELYPLLKGACEFYFDYLIEHPTERLLVTIPSLSPENRHPFGSSLTAGPAMDSQLLRDLFTRSIEAARLLGRDREFRARAASFLKRLPQDRIGKAGQLQEWLADWDMEAPDIQHRHVSHLYALHPSDQITPEDTPILAAAARKSLEIRGDDATGWGIGWRINLWARLLDGDRAHDVLKLLLSPRRSYPNLFDAHPPFQIDGNFGAAAGIGEMLLQSHRNRIRLLPALPAAWPAGKVKGLRARGGFEIDMSWSAGQLHEAIIRSQHGGHAVLSYGSDRLPLRMKSGATRRIRVQHGRLTSASA